MKLNDEDTMQLMSYDTKLNDETKSALESERIYRSILIYLYK